MSEELNNSISALEEKTRSRKEKAARSATEEKQKSKKGTIIFYSVYAALILVFVIAIAAVMNPLKNWLISYEASQPDTMRQQVYDEYFANPNWDKLYDLAAIEDTAFEGKGAFVTYMNAKVAAATDSTLSCEETSAGLSGNHKYLLKLDGEKVAAFTLEPAGESRDAVTGWELGDIEFFFTRAQSVTIQKLPGQTVTVNGVTLDDSYTIRTVTTKAEDYLPEGMHGYRMEQQTVTGLLVAPEVTLIDANGQPITLIADPETGILKAEGDNGVMEIPETHKTLAIEAAKAYAKFAIRKISSYELSKYFDTNSELYQGAVNSLAFLKKISSYTFRDDLAVADYYCYSDDFFSVRVSLTMDIVTANGYKTNYDSNMTYFFKKNSSGKFIVVDGTNLSITEQVEQVRLQFMNGDTLLESMMVNAASATVTAPQVETPQGQVFKGWAVKSTGENGNTNMTILLTPGENGVANVASGTKLEPAVLYAVFGAAE